MSLSDSTEGLTSTTANSSVWVLASIYARALLSSMEDKCGSKALRRNFLLMPERLRLAKLPHKDPGPLQVFRPMEAATIRTSRTQTAMQPTPIAGARSTFYFPPYLQPPHMHPYPWAQSKPSQDKTGPTKAKGPILIVEDDPAILSSIVDILEFEGYSVETATDGAEGLAQLARVTPTLILLDMRMPVLNGWDFARIVKERGIEVPILVMTAAQDARRWAQEVGAEGFIAKPFHILDLISSVERFHPGGPEN